MSIGSIGELLWQLLWDGFHVWIHSRILGRSFYWILFTLASIGAVWGFSNGLLLLGFILAVVAMFLLLPAWFSED